MHAALAPGRALGAVCPGCAFFLRVLGLRGLAGNGAPAALLPMFFLCQVVLAVIGAFGPLG